MKLLSCHGQPVLQHALALKSIAAVALALLAVALPLTSYNQLNRAAEAVDLAGALRSGNSVARSSTASHASVTAARSV